MNGSLNSYQFESVEHKVAKAKEVFGDKRYDYTVVHMERVCPHDLLQGRKSWAETCLFVCADLKDQIQ